MTIKVASLFDGIGGTPFCATMCGAEPVWASEIEPFPIKVTKYHFPDMKHYGDICKIKGNEVEPVDIIVGGSPCQDLSVAGQRKGMKHSDFGDEEATRSGLFMEQVRIVKEMRNGTNGTQPRYMVWENVPGAFSSKGSGDSLEAGEAFRIVLEETARIADPTVRISRPPEGWFNSGSILGDGFSISWRTVDAQYWGVPQRRRRIYLVADFRGQSAPEILFEREGMPWHFEKSISEGQGTPGEAEDRTRKAISVQLSGDRDNPSVSIREEIAFCIPANPMSDRGQAVLPFNTTQITSPQNGNNPDYGDPCHTLAATDHPPAICIQGSMIGRADENGPQGSGINEDVSFTLNTTDRHSVFCDLYNHSITGDVAATLNASSCASPTASGPTVLDSIVYGICSDNSNSMKSDNPHSGIYEADTARTIDGNGGNPACNQGGMLVYENHPADRRVTGPHTVCQTVTSRWGTGGGNVPFVQESAYTMLMREGKEGGGKGPLIQTDKASTLMAGGQQTLFEPTYCSTTGSYMQSEEEKSPTLMARDYKDPHIINTQNATVRRLTPLECERLQGYPDGWSDTPPQKSVTAEDIAFWRTVWDKYDEIMGKNKHSDNQIKRWLMSESTDSDRYEALGNSFAIPNAYFVISGCVEKVRECQ